MTTLDTDHHAEKRRYVRIPHQIKVMCGTAGNGAAPVEGVTQDISRGGVRLRLDRLLDVGIRLHVALRNPQYDMCVDLTGTVVWAETLPEGAGYEAGVRFSDLTTEQNQNLLTLIRLLGGDDGEDRRAYIRLQRPVHAHITVRKLGGLFTRRLEGVAQDLSIEGMAVACGQRLRPDSACEVEIRLLQPACVRVRVLCVDRRPQEPPWVMRMRFETYHDDARMRIGRYLCHEIERESQAAKRT
jgi:c-di-GMP-binding flagellar brake protein YcgR